MIAFKPNHHVLTFDKMKNTHRAVKIYEISVKIYTLSVSCMRNRMPMNCVLKNKI